MQPPAAYPLTYPHRADGEQLDAARAAAAAATTAAAAAGGAGVDPGACKRVLDEQAKGAAVQVRGREERWEW